MELTVSEQRIILDALIFKCEHLRQEQSALDETQQDSIAELSNDIYYLELLIQSIRDDYKKRIEQMESLYQEPLPEFASMAISPGIHETSKTYRTAKTQEEQET